MTRFPGVLMLAASLAAAAPALADPPPHAPAHGWRAKQQYRYVYYPEREIYYAPDAGNWFWLDGGNWRVGGQLPTRYVPYASGGGISISLDTDRPYTEHDDVVQQYGKGKKPKKQKH